MPAKTILITGASGAIGSKVSQYLDINHPIIAADISLTALEPLKLSSKATKVELDVCSDASVTTLLQQHANIDTLIHCAYPKTPHFGKPWSDVKPQEVEEELNAQLVSTYRLASACYQHFEAQNSAGQIILLSSIYGEMTPRFALYESQNFTMPLEYALVKAGTHQLIRYLAAYAIAEQHNIIVQGIAPGGVAANQPDSFKQQYCQKALFPGMLNAQEIAECCHYLLSDAGRALHGHILTLDYGFSLHS